jgi:hypothetical protein
MTSESKSDRAPRQRTFLVVRIFKSKYFQLFGADAQLVDLSERGMKLKFIGGVKLKDRQKFLVRIPHPESPDKHFQMEAEARWYNPKEFTLGVYLPDLSDVELQVIQHYMVVSKKMGRVTV